MSDMPERILAWREEDEYIDHVLITKCWVETSVVPSWDATEYVRSDLAAPDLAELVDLLNEPVSTHRDAGWIARRAAALAKLKEQTK